MSNGTSPPQIPEEAHGIFAGPVDQLAVQKISNALVIAANNNIRHIHLMFQSAGGQVADGVCLYNLLRASPVEITIYNVGSICSAGVIAYLGPMKRIVNPNGTFMIHRTYFNPIGANSDRLQNFANTEGSPESAKCHERRRSKKANGSIHHRRKQRSSLHD